MGKDTDRTIALFGIPVDIVSMEDVIARILKFREGFRQDQRPRLIATLNVDFVVNSLSFIPGRVRHPELLDILCRADLVTADGMPLVWLSRLLGAGLPERVTGADLVPQLARVSGRHKLRLFFLGGAEDSALKAAEILQTQFPDMVLAGGESPFVKTEGLEMAFSEDQDLDLVQRINEAKPDVLLIAFGNPKQEIWFNRNRYRLKVPVSIGIGGTFEFITGKVKRAPYWMQRTGMEWIWRISQDPARLWKRYAVGLCKLAVLSGSLLLFTSLFAFFGRKKRGGMRGNAFVTPPCITEQYLLQLFPRLREMQKEGMQPQLDFVHTRRATLPALGSLLRFLHQNGDAGKSIILRNRGRWFSLFLSGVHGLAPLKSTVRSVGGKQLSSIPSRRFAYSLEQRNGVAVIALQGRLDAAYKSLVSIDEILDGVRGRQVVVDASGLSFADSSGIGLFLRLHNLVSEQGNVLHVAGAQGAAKQMLSITRLDRVFSLHGTRIEALEAMGKE